MNNKLIKQSARLLSVRSLMAVLMCLLLSTAFTSCGDDDDEPSSKGGLLGEWIRKDGSIYYSFLSDGTGRYICLPDEPGYDPEYPDAVIKHPVDPCYYDYTLEGDILTMKEYYDESKTDFTIYVCRIEVSGDVLQMSTLRWSDDGVNWNEYETPGWSTYLRWTPSK